jgi:hypothetical protein
MAYEPIDTGFGFYFDPEERPDAYLRWAEQYYSMIVHTQGHNPGKLLYLQRPNEADDIYRYRLANFEAITKGAISRAKNEVFSPIGSAKFSYKVDEDTEEFIERPVFGMSEGYGTGYDYWQYIFKVACERIIDDPNGYITWMPFGEGTTDPTQKVDVYPYQIYSVCITRLTKDRITFYKPEERFYLNSGTTGRIFYTIDREAYYRHYEIELPDDKTTFGTELIYRHNLGEIPIVLNGGFRKSAIGQFDYKTRKAVWGESTYMGWSPYSFTSGSALLQNTYLPQFIDYLESFFVGFVGYANEALKTFDDWKGARVMTSNPIRVEKQMPCTAEGCNNGYVWGHDSEGNDSRRACNTCNGSGVMVRSPFGIYQVKVPDSTTLENQTLVDDPVSYVSPPVDGLEYMQKAWETLIHKAELELYQLFTDSAQSGEAKKVDREGKYAMIMAMSNHIFDHIIYNHLNFLIRLRNIVNPEPPIIVKPTSFAIRDEGMIIEELKQLNEANAPIPVKVKAQKDLMKKRFSGKAEASEVIELMVQFDPLYGQSMEDIERMQRMGAIDTRSVQKHAYCYHVLERVMEKVDDMEHEMEEPEILALMETEFNTIVPPPATQIQIPVFE